MCYQIGTESWPSVMAEKVFWMEDLVDFGVHRLMAALLAVGLCWVAGLGGDVGRAVGCLAETNKFHFTTGFFKERPVSPR